MGLIIGIGAYVVIALVTLVIFGKIGRENRKQDEIFEERLKELENNNLKNPKDESKR